MSFKESITLRYIKIITPNLNRSKSLHESSKHALKTALEIQLSPYSNKTILRELYESLRELCEAIGYKHGFKFQSHESIMYFLKDELNEIKIATKFNKYRVLRNDINYYGKNINLETVIKAKQEIPEIIKKLETHLLKK